MSQQEIFTNGKIRHDSLNPAILGDKSDAGPDRIGGASRCVLFSIKVKLSTLPWTKPKERLDRFRASCSYQSSQSEYFPSVHLERDVANEGCRAEIPYFKHRRLRRAHGPIRANGQNLLHFLANHQANQLRLSQRRCFERLCDCAPFPHHRYAVCNCKNFLESMRDKHQGMTRPLQGGHDLKQTLNFRRT